jgi:hypothetical protein
MIQPGRGAFSDLGPSELGHGFQKSKGMSKITSAQRHVVVGQPLRSSRSTPTRHVQVLERTTEQNWQECNPLELGPLSNLKRVFGRSTWPVPGLGSAHD